MCSEMVEEFPVDESWRERTLRRILGEVKDGKLKLIVEEHLRDSREAEGAAKALILDEEERTRRLEKIERLGKKAGGGYK